MASHDYDYYIKDLVPKEMTCINEWFRMTLPQNKLYYNHFIIDRIYPHLVCNPILDYILMYVISLSLFESYNEVTYQDME